MVKKSTKQMTDDYFGSLAALENIRSILVQAWLAARRVTPRDDATITALERQ